MEQITAVEQTFLVHVREQSEMYFPIKKNPLTLVRFVKIKFPLAIIKLERKQSQMG